MYSPGELALLLGAEAYAGVLGLSQRTLVAVRDGSIEGFAAMAVPAADVAGAEPSDGGGLVEASRKR